MNEIKDQLDIDQQDKLQELEKESFELSSSPWKASIRDGILHIKNKIEKIMKLLLRRSEIAYLKLKEEWMIF